MSSDPWYDWLITYGLPDDWPCPPELAHLLPDGIDGAWTEDQDGNVIPPYLFPPLPAGAPECARQWRDAARDSMINGYMSAKERCAISGFAFRFEFDPGIRRPAGWNFGPFVGPGQPPLWGDPCASGIFFYPTDCPWLDNFLGGFNTNGCPPDYVPNTFFRPGVHRAISEILRPTAMPFLWRLEFDLVLWPTVFRPEVLSAGNACTAYAGALLLQLEALQELLNEAGNQTGRALIQFTRGFDGALSDARYQVFTEDGLRVGEGRIGWNRVLEIGFCPDETDGVFRVDIGRRPCDDEGDDDMGCDCDQVRAIVRDELEGVTNSHLDPIKAETDFLGSLLRAVESPFRAFFGDGDNSWATFLSRFSFLSAFIRPANTDPDTVISPPLPDRLDAEFEKNRKRLVQVYASVQRRVKVRVQIEIEGEKQTSRDVVLHGARSGVRRPHNHFGQFWLRVETSRSGIEKVYPWVWIRSRSQTLLLEVWDERLTSDDLLVIHPEYQLFEGLRVTKVTVLAELPRFSDLNSDPIWQPPPDDSGNSDDVTG